MHYRMRWDYRPYFNFHGKGPKYYGIELEVFNPNSYSGANAKMLHEVISILNNVDKKEDYYGDRDSEVYAYAVYDSSVYPDGHDKEEDVGDGFEIVSHPATIDFHMSKMRWEDALNYLSSQGYESHNAECCGLHVHIDRRAFKDLESLAKFIYIFEKYWHYIVEFSRRKDWQLERYAQRYRIRTFKDVEQVSCIPQGKYYSVNLSNSNTVEVRVFRGTLDYDVLMASLQLVDLLVTVSNESTLEELYEGDWVSITKEAQHEELTSYLEELDLNRNKFSTVNIRVEMQSGDSTKSQGEESDEDVLRLRCSRCGSVSTANEFNRATANVVGMVLRQTVQEVVARGESNSFCCPRCEETVIFPNSMEVVSRYPSLTELRALRDLQEEIREMMIERFTT